VLLWGFTAILGKLITLPALPLVWWRMGLVVLALALLPRVWRGVRALPPRLLLSYAGIGVLVALHWLTFYGSIKLANASVGATCMALATVFTALAEPKLAGRRFSARELGLGIAVLPGPRDALLLLALAGACTLFPFALSLVALRHMSAFAAQLAVNLEPVYAIVLAIVLLGEQHELDPAFYGGVAIILGAVFAYPLLVRPRRLEHLEVLATAESKDVTR
jgi:drug/metabolite transporter (DMT)-like permease